jgi:hypothetical protein
MTFPDANRMNLLLGVSRVVETQCTVDSRATLNFATKYSDEIHGLISSLTLSDSLLQNTKSRKSCSPNVPVATHCDVTVSSSLHKQFQNSFVLVAMTIDHHS